MKCNSKQLLLHFVKMLQLQQLIDVELHLFNFLLCGNRVGMNPSEHGTLRGKSAKGNLRTSLHTDNVDEDAHSCTCT